MKTPPLPTDDGNNTKLYSYFKEKPDPKKEYGFGWGYWFVNPGLVKDFLSSELERTRRETEEKTKRKLRSILGRMNKDTTTNANMTFQWYALGWNKAITDILSKLK